MQDIVQASGLDPTDAIAAVLVVFFAVGRFNTPRSARSQTSRFQYWGSCTAYAVACLGLLMAISWFLSHHPEALAILHWGGGAIPDELPKLESPLVAALILTAFIPAFPWIREIDVRLLRFFHRLGSIPFGAGRWAQQMENAAFTASPGLLAQIRTFIDNSPALPAWIAEVLRAEPESDRSAYRFTRNLGLLVSIHAQPIRSRFADEYAEDWEAFEKLAAGFITQSSGFFSLRSQLAGDASPAASSALHNAQEAFDAAALPMYEELRLMLARILLYGCSGEGEVARRLRAIGFDVKRPPTVRIPGNLLALDLLGVIAIFVAMALVTSQSRGGLDLTGALLLGLQVAIGHCIAASFALLPKQIFGFADIRCSGERPFLWYVIFALVAALCVLPVSFVFNELRMQLAISAHPTLPFVQRCKWLLAPFMMSLALAFACDDSASRETEPRWLSVIESASIALLLALTGAFVLRWQQESGLIRTAGVPEIRYFVPLIIGAAMGALFGATIPRWYRHLLRQASPELLVRRADRSKQAPEPFRPLDSRAA